MAITATASLSVQDQYSSTTSASFSASDTTLYLSGLPTPSEGFLTLFTGTAVSEVVYYTSKGANFVTIPSAVAGAGRGMYGTPAAFASGTTVKMTVNADYWKELQNGHAFGAGIPVQMTSGLSGAVATGTTLIPYDDTIPQITEGDQYLTLSITPRSATNRLRIDVDFMASSDRGAGNHIIGALFQDATAGALAASAQYVTTSTAAGNVKFSHDMVAGTTSSTTFRLRCGQESAGTMTFNGQSAARRFGGISVSSIKIIEYKA